MDKEECSVVFYTDYHQKADGVGVFYGFDLDTGSIFNAYKLEPHGLVHDWGGVRAMTREEIAQCFEPVREPDACVSIGDFWRSGEVVAETSIPVDTEGPPATLHKALPARCLDLPDSAAFMLGRVDLT